MRAPLFIAVLTLSLLSACDGVAPGGRGRVGASARLVPRIIEPEVKPAVLSPGVPAPVQLEPVRLLPPIVRGPHQVDSFVQDEAVVDVLFVVDNSASLSNERTRLAAQFSRFLRVLVDARVDFHVGVTSTDLSSPSADDGRLRGRPRFIDRNTPNPEAAFSAAVNFPTDLDVRLEEGMQATLRALTPPRSTTENLGFVRDEAALAVIVVSDEDDGSLGRVPQYVRFLQGLKGPGREVNVSISAVVGDQPDGCVAPAEAHIFGARAKAGDRYIEAARATNGLVESVCSANFGPFVEALATTLSALRRFFPLSAPPTPGTVVVTVAGRIVPQSNTAGWTLRAAERGIAFEGMYVPPPGAEIRIEYDVAL